MIKSIHKKISSSIFNQHKNDDHYLILVVLFCVVITCPAFMEFCPYPIFAFNIIFICFILYGIVLLERISIAHIITGIGTIILLAHVSLLALRNEKVSILENQLEFTLVIIYLALLGIRLLKDTLKENVSLKLIYISISNYLTLGLMFGFIFKLLHLNDPNAFNFNVNEAYQHIYMSFVILTSVGLGDLLPLSNAAKSLVVLEAITGQLYLTFFVAIVIGKYLVKSNVKVRY